LAFFSGLLCCELIILLPGFFFPLFAADVPLFFWFWVLEGLFAASAM
jgi:hypothetical protein